MSDLVRLTVICISSLWFFQQNPAPAPGPGEAGYRPESGTLIEVDVPRSLDANKLKPGEELQARVTLDLLYDNKIIVPRQAKVIGKVLDVQILSKTNLETRLLLAFERIVTKDGREIQFAYPAYVRALGPDRHAAAGAATVDSSPSMPEISRPKARYTATPFVIRDPSSENYGLLVPTAAGVIALPTLKLEDSPKGVYIVAPKAHVRLDYGTQMILQVASPEKYPCLRVKVHLSLANGC